MVLTSLHWNSRDLKGLIATQLTALLDGVDVGTPLRVDPPCELCDSLELFIPQVLRREHHEWETESIDGFYFSSAVKTDEEGALLAGTCILINDQTVTPLMLNLSVSHGSIRSVRIRLGERGNGALGISGPDCTSRAARRLLLGLNARLDQIEWVYDVTL